MTVHWKKESTKTFGGLSDTGSEMILIPEGPTTKVKFYNVQIIDEV